MWDNILSFFKSLWDGIKNIWNTVSTWFKTKVIDPLVNFFKNAWNNILNFFKSLWDGIKNIWNTVSTWFNDNVIKPVVGFFKGLWESISGFFVGLWDGIKNIWEGVSNWFKTKVIEPLKQLFEGLGEKIAAVWDGIVTWVEKVLNAVIDGINWLADGINKAAEKVGIEADLAVSSADLNSDGVFSRFATGGIADYTGLAWLDGTPSKPEIVLNQRDSQNFLALKDVLADVMSHGGFGNSSTENGNNYYEIEINVDKIDNDYDVEQMANKIKDLIYEDSTYRNVNTINQIR
jgi:predicted PurR-regulated permease PerM